VDDETFFEPGDRFHGHVIERLVAVGGSAAVYEARDPALGRTVAIKFLRHGLQPADWDRRALAREGRRAARLEHPAFLTVYGLLEHQGRAALVMEWVDGETLSERMARAPLPLEAVRRIFGQLAEALSIAHAAELVHGDLSPANVMLRPDGTIKILDPAPPPPPGRQPGSRATRPYAAPEVLRGERPSPASDVHAFGVMLEEALAGRRGRGTRALRRLVHRCLEDDPALRPDGAGALTAPFRPDRSGFPTVSRRVAASLAAVLAAAVAAGFFGGWWAARRAPVRGAGWRGLERLRVEGSLPVLLGDGSAVIYRSRDDRGIEILPLASGVPRTVWHGDRVIEDLAAFPDGRTVLFSSPGEEGTPWLWEIAIDGGLPRRIAPGTAPAVSSDTRKIAALQLVGDGVSRVVVLDGEGAAPRPLHTFRNALVPVAVVFGPGDRSLLVPCTDGIHRSVLLEIALDDGATRTVGEVRGVATPGAALHRRLGTVLWPVRTAARGEASLIASPLEGRSPGAVYQGPGRTSRPSLDNQGRALAFQLSEIDTELVELAVDPGAGPPVTAMDVLPGSRGASQPRVGPDPSLLLFQSSTGSVQLMNRSTGRTRPLLHVGTAQYNPSWSPDGRRIACACLDGGHSDLWIVPAQGGVPERLTTDDGNDFQPVWHPDGRHILFVSDRDGLDDLYTLDLSDGDVHRLGTDGAVNPTVSSDGRLVAFVVGATGPSPRLRLARLEVAAGILDTVWERPVVIDRWAGAKARFSPDGHWLAFDQPRAGGGADIWAVPVEDEGGTRAIRLTALPFPASLTGWFDWGPDWKIVATVARRTDRICILHDASWWIRNAGS